MSILQGRIVQKELHKLKKSVLILNLKITELEDLLLIEQANEKLEVHQNLSNNDCEKLGFTNFSPTEAFDFYNSSLKDFIIIDVSEESFKSGVQLLNRKFIALERLEFNIHLLKNKALKCLIISETGDRSIQASRMLAKLGFYNVFNVAGGYAQWPAQLVRINEKNQNSMDC